MAMVKIVAMVLALAVGSSWARCPPRNESIPLNLDKFVGTWYLEATTPDLKNLVTNCSAFEVRKDGPAAFSITFIVLNLERHEAITYYMKGTNHGDIVGTWRIGGTSITANSLIYRIVEADYNNRFSWVGCPQTNQNSNASKNYVILSRAQPLSPTVLTASKNKLGAYVGVENIYEVGRGNCSG